MIQPPHMVAASFILRELDYAREGFPAFIASWSNVDWWRVVHRLQELGHGRRSR